MTASIGQHGFARVDEEARPASWVECLDTLHREPFYREYKDRVRAIEWTQAFVGSTASNWRSDFMKAYIMTTGTIFGLITVAHLLRIAAEGSRLATDPWFVLLTVVAAALSVWAFRLLRPGTRA